MKKLFDLLARKPKPDPLEVRVTALLDAMTELKRYGQQNGPVDFNAPGLKAAYMKAVYAREADPSINDILTKGLPLVCDLAGTNYVRTNDAMIRHAQTQRPCRGRAKVKAP